MIRCQQCGAPVLPPQIFYCSAKCRKWASNRRYRARYRQRLIDRSRNYRNANPDAQRQSCQSWRERHPNYYKIPCPECGGLMNKGAKRCDPCRLKFEAPCVGNPHCAVTGSHKHCPACGEPIRRRWDALCAPCETDRRRFGATVGEYLFLGREQEKEAA